MVKLDDKVGMVVCGDPGDAASFGELVQKNIQLYKIRHGYSLSPHAAANFIRKYLADSLRRNPYLVNLLMGGFSEDQGTSLYYMDYLGTMTKVPFASHGYGSFFTLSIMDKYYREDLSEQEAIELIGKCITEVGVCSNNQLKLQ
jgi:20S proteasome subunit beta 4